MSIEDFLLQSADITCEAAPGDVPAQDASGGADRSARQWQPVASGVPCLVRPMGSARQDRDDARRGIDTGRIYFASDPVPDPEGISSRHRITVAGAIYAVMGATNPNSLDRIIQVDVERVRTP